MRRGRNPQNSAGGAEGDEKAAYARLRRSSSSRDEDTSRAAAVGSGTVVASRRTLSICITTSGESEKKPTKTVKLWPISGPVAPVVKEVV